MVWHDPGHAVIDTTVVHDSDHWYRFAKDERIPDAHTPEAKFITAEWSAQLAYRKSEFGLRRYVPFVADHVDTADCSARGPTGPLSESLRGHAGVGTSAATPELVKRDSAGPPRGR